MLPTLPTSPIVQALHQNAVPALRRLSVEEYENAIVLRGKVPSYYLKQLAQEAVLPLLAGRTLANQVEVRRDGSPC